MKTFLKDKSIHQINIFATFFAILFIAIFAFAVIYIEYITFQKEIKKVEKEYFKSQKDIIVKETNRALKFIQHKHKYSHNRDLKEIKKDIVETIENMRNERDGTGYIFIYDFNGINIADPILKQNAGKNLINFTDLNGKKVIEELIEVSKREKGGFVEYLWNKPIVHKLSAKISYAKAYKPWKWMVGTGVYLDSIKEVIKQKRDEHKKKVLIFVAIILSFTVTLFLIIAVFSQLISNILKDEIKVYINFFKKASTSYEYMDSNKLYFKEFKSSTVYANSMVTEIREKTKALEDLNATLEEKVELKTKKLKKEKEFSENLLKMQNKFLKNSVHEVNTPLSIILTNIDLLAIKGVQNRHLTRIEAASKIIHNIYNDLTYMIKKDLIEYKRVKLNFTQFLIQRLDFFSEVANSNKLKFNANIDSNLFIEFNEVKLQRLCDNNISNAIKYSFENSMIEVKLFKNVNKVIFEIKNNGEEIKDIEKLFNRFYREDNVKGGFGIGLNIVREICTQDDIKIEVKSENQLNTFRYIFKELNENITT